MIWLQVVSDEVIYLIQRYDFLYSCQHFLKERHSGRYAYNNLNGLNAFDCRHKKVSLLHVEVYQDAKMMESYKPDKAASNRPIIPGTVEYFAYRYLCVPGKK